jgi:hypothetical protein
MTDEDQAWLDALAGRAPEGSGGPAAREARRLREFIQRNVRTPDVTIPTRDTQREGQLLERARREGLVDAAQLGRRGRQLIGVRSGRWIGLAAGVVGIAAALALFLRLAPPTEHVRSAHESVTRIEAADPTALKVEILDELRAAGVTATGYEALGIEGIDAQLPKPVPPGVRDILTRHHLSVPGNGVLRIEIAARSTP